MHLQYEMHACMHGLCVCLRACVLACIHACVVYVCVCVCVCVHVYVPKCQQTLATLAAKVSNMTIYIYSYLDEDKAAISVF